MVCPASDVTDTEWALIEGFVPAANKLGRPRTTAMREVVNALLYLLTTGCQWRRLPKEFRPFSTVQRFSTGGGKRGCGKRSITPWSCGFAPRPGARPAPRPE